MVASNNKNVTLNDVAIHSGVSYQTVSRVINNHPNVAAHTRERVLQSIKALNYRPNQAARSLVTGSSNTIAIISFGTTFYGPSQMVSNITRQAKSSGYRVTLNTVDRLTREDIRATLDEVRSHFIDGIVMVAPIISDDMSIIGELVDVPFVQIDTAPLPHLASVVIEQAYGSKLATEHLIDLGHRHIAEISGPLNWHDAGMRHDSWIETMQAHGLAHDLSVEGDWTARSGYGGVKALMERDAEFTGIVLGNDQMALGAIAALHESGLRVPEDVSIIGFDDIPESAHYLPALTTVKQDFTALGEQSVDYLVSLIKNPKTPVHQRVLHPELIIRNSTRSLK